MIKILTKNQKSVHKIIKHFKSYNLEDAIYLLKKITFTKFDSSVDLAIHLGVDSRKPNEVVRGVVKLPHGNGKNPRILVLATPDFKEKLLEINPTYIGTDEYIEKIKKGWLDFDIIVSIPSLMPKLGGLGKILGPRGLMPNPRSGTVTLDPYTAVKDIKSGKIDFKVDKYGIIHVSVAKVSFSFKKILDNILELINILIKLKPPSSKGDYIKSIYLSSTMSSSILINLKSLFKIKNNIL